MTCIAMGPSGQGPGAVSELLGSCREYFRHRLSLASGYSRTCSAECSALLSAVRHIIVETVELKWIWESYDKVLYF